MLALASIAVLAAGCAHDTLGSGTVDLNVVYSPNPAGVGRYERASFDVSVIHALPADPATAAVYGSNEILFRFDSFTADLTLNQDVAFTHIALSPGTYRVTKIAFGQPFLVDTNVSSTPATCIEGISSVASGPANSQVLSAVPFTFTNPASLNFTVSPGQSRLAFKVNVPALIAGYESSFTCQADCGSGTPCLTAFNQTTYRNALLAAVSFE